MIRLNLLPDHLRVMGRPTDRMIDDDGNIKVIMPRFARYAGRVRAVVGGLSRMQGGYCIINVYGPLDVEDSCELRKVNDGPRLCN
jgi:hypothetical protein